MPVLGQDAKEASPGLREAVCDLALRLPYRQAAEVVTRLTGSRSPACRPDGCCWPRAPGSGPETGGLNASVFVAGSTKRTTRCEHDGLGREQASYRS